MIKTICFRILKKLGLLCPCMVILLASCGGESGSSKPTSSPRGGRDRLPTQDVDKCKSTQILDISRNGRSILSAVNTKEQIGGIVSWDIRSKEIWAEYRYQLSFQKTSPDGKFLIKELSRNRYQVLSFWNNRITYSAMIRTNSINAPKLDFTLDSKYVLINSQPIGTDDLNQFDIFDIQKKRFVKSFRARGIKFMKMTKDSNYIVMGYDNGYEKFLAMYTLNSFEEVFTIKLPRYGNFSFLESAMDRIIIRSDNDYFAFDTTTGEKVFEGSYNFLYDVSNSGRYALITKERGSFSVLDTKDGSIVSTNKIPNQIELSTCQLTDSPIQIVCKDRLNAGKVFVMDLESKESVSVCI